MDTYKFYYDESEHSRKINYSTVTAPNYYDNFVTVIVGWLNEEEKDVFKKYEDFENKYADHKDRNGELKSMSGWSKSSLNLDLLRSIKSIHSL